METTLDKNGLSIWEDCRVKVRQAVNIKTQEKLEHRCTYDSRHHWTRTRDQRPISAPPGELNNWKRQVNDAGVGIQVGRGEPNLGIT